MNQQHEVEKKIEKQLREIEKCLDEEYLKNPLIRLPGSTAYWYLLTAYEALVEKEILFEKEGEQK